LALAIAGYLGVWRGFGIAAHGADWFSHEIVERSSWLEANAWLISAITLLLAGGFQFSRSAACNTAVWLSIARH